MAQKSNTAARQKEEKRQAKESVEPVTVQRETIDLLSHYMPTTPIPPYRVSVPTKGVFAEAVMGACNSCEKIDNDRFWKWEEHPIDDPTAINPISAPVPTFNNPNLAAKDFAQPIVNIQNAPAVPDPQGVNAVAGLLGKELFKDITGLDQNQKNALAAMMEGNKGSSDAMEAGMQMAQLAQQYALLKDAKEKGMMPTAKVDKNTADLFDKAINKDGTNAGQHTGSANPLLTALTSSPELTSLVNTLASTNPEMAQQILQAVIGGSATGTDNAELLALLRSYDGMDVSGLINLLSPPPIA